MPKHDFCFGSGQWPVASSQYLNISDKTLHATGDESVSVVGVSVTASSLQVMYMVLTGH
jgi:hypothetical protein